MDLLTVISDLKTIKNIEVEIKYKYTNVLENDLKVRITEKLRNKEAYYERDNKERGQQLVL